MSIPDAQPPGVDKVARTARIEEYLRRFRAAMDQRHHDLRFGDPDPTTPKKAAYYFWQVVRETWTRNDFYVHPWAIKTVDRLCHQDRRLAMFGAKQTSKSTTMAAWMLVLYWAYLDRGENDEKGNPTWQATASVIYRTTTLEEAIQRGWGELIRLLGAAKQRAFLPGHYIKSKPPKVIAYEGSPDAKKAIVMKPARSVGRGASSDFGSVKGFHADVQLLVDDELNELPDTAIQAPQALDADYKMFAYVGIGNPISWDDCLGRLGSPTEIDVKEIADYNLDEWQINGGTALRFSADKSPNITEPRLPNGEWRYKHLPVPGTLERLIADCGSEDHPNVWQFGYGLPAPDGVNFTVLSNALVRQFGAHMPARWGIDPPEQGCALDPSFTAGGDDCQLLWFEWGWLADGGWSINFKELEVLQLAKVSKEDVFYYIANEVKKKCLLRGVPPQHFGMDATGTGLGMVSMMRRVWSPAIHYTESGGNPSTDPVSLGDQRQAKSVFDRKLSEILWGLRSFIEHSQVKGLYDERAVVVLEGSQRRYWKHRNRIVVEPKDDVYRRNKSSDRLDVAAVACATLRQLGFIPGGQGGGARQSIERTKQSVRPEAEYIADRETQFRDYWRRKRVEAANTPPPGMSGLGGDGFDTSNIKSG